LVVITDRGGHLHDMLRLVDQLGVPPQALITTIGPDVSYLQKSSPRLETTEIISVPQSFSWIGKRRVWNPWLFLRLLFLSVSHAMRLQPKFVVSTGASNVVFFCYCAHILGAKIFHIENLAQVVNPSVTGRILYPIARGFYVQWEELLKQYGPKAEYKGWVL
jgi:UDP-N-acetylglucosamine:LPS N-acetylglucosamine transferase